MATAEITPPPSIDAQQMEPGIQAPQEPPKSQVLPRQVGLIPSSNVKAVFAAGTLPNPRPPRVLFAGLRDPKLRMVQAIPLDVSVEESTVLVSWSEINEFGTGKTLSSAIDDFSSGLRELYWHLLSPEITLGEDLQKVRSTVERYIQQR